MKLHFHTKQYTIHYPFQYHVYYYTNILDFTMFI
jgi:hypothetical protein